MPHPHCNTCILGPGIIVKFGPLARKASCTGVTGVADRLMTYLLLVDGAVGTGTVVVMGVVGALGAVGDMVAVGVVVTLLVLLLLC